jgi:hypothetical protein
MDGAAAQGMGEFSQLLLGICAGALLAMAAAPALLSSSAPPSSP